MRSAARRARAAALFTAAVIVAACSGRRERLDVPRIALEVADQSPPPGGHVVGRVSAADASGLTLLAVYACTADSVYRSTADLDRDRSAGFDFSLYVASTATPGAALEVYAIAGDDQGFFTDTARRLVVGSPPPPIGTPSTARASVRTSVTSGTAAADTTTLCPHASTAARRAAQRALPVANAPITAPRP